MSHKTYRERRYYFIAYFSSRLPKEDELTVRQKDALSELDAVIAKWLPKVLSLPDETRRIFRHLLDAGIEVDISKTGNNGCSLQSRWRMHRSRSKPDDTLDAVSHELDAYFKMDGLFTAPTRKQLRQLKIAKQAAHDINVAFVRLCKRFGVSYSVLWNEPGSRIHNVRLKIDFVLARRQPVAHQVVPNKTGEATSRPDTRRIRSLERQMRKLERRLSPLAMRLYMQGQFIDSRQEKHEKKLERVRAVLSGIVMGPATREPVAQVRELMSKKAIYRKLTTDNRTPSAMLSILGH